MEIIPGWKKRYVICHMRLEGGLEELYKVVPNPQGLTNVNRYSYNLEDSKKVFTYQGRKHFVLDELDALPKTFKETTKEEIIFNAAEIQTALNNAVMDYLFTKKKELILIGLAVLAIIAVVFIALTYSKLGMMESTLQGISEYMKAQVVP